MTALKLCNAIVALLLVCSMATAFHMISPEKAAETITTTTTMTTTTTSSTLKRVATSADGSASPTSAIDMELTTIQATAEQQSPDAGPTTATAPAKQPPATNDDESASIGSSEENPEITATSTPLTGSSATPSSSSQVPPTTKATTATGPLTTGPPAATTITGASAVKATAATPSRVEPSLPPPTTTKSVITAAAAAVGHKEAAAAAAPKLKEDNASEDLDYMKDAPFDEAEHEGDDLMDVQENATDSNEMKPRKPHELSGGKGAATGAAETSNVTSHGPDAPTTRPATSSTGASTSSTGRPSVNHGDIGHYCCKRCCLTPRSCRRCCTKAQTGPCTSGVATSHTGAYISFTGPSTSSTGSSATSTDSSTSSSGSSGESSDSSTSSTGFSGSSTSSSSSSSDIYSTASDTLAPSTPIIVTTVSPVLRITTKTAATSFSTTPSSQQQQEEVTSTIGSLGESSASSTTKKTVGQMNIADLYPVRLEDFGPIIRDSNAELLKERTIFKATDNEEHRQNLMPNEVEDHQQVGSSAAAAGRLNQMESDPGLAAGAGGGSISDFTGKLLAEQDGVITEIEQKFRLAGGEEEAKGEVKPGEPVKRDKLSFSVNHQIPQRQHYPQFIERRVKKSFEFPMHRVAADGVLQPHVDFAQTKFNTDNSRHPPALVTGGGQGERMAGGGAAASGDKAADDLAPMPLGAHPEFSTTKFYNSKELYNEMMMHNHNSNNNNNNNNNNNKNIDSNNNKNMDNTKHLNENNNNNNGGKPKTMTIIMPQYAATTTEAAPAPLKPLAAATGAPKMTKQKLATALPIAKFRSFQHLTDFRPSNQKIATTPKPAAVKATATDGGDTTQTDAEKLRKIQKDLRRAKSLLEAASAVGAKQEATATTTTTASGAVTQSSVTRSSSMSGRPQAMTANAIDREAEASTTSRSIGGGSITTINTSFDDSSLASPSTSIGTTTTATNVNSPTMASLKPIARPRILRRLQEKINSLECEIQNVPQDSHLWRGNETHELLLPIVEVPKNCSHREDTERCGQSTNSWNGEAEIQSGDVLIVEINDAALTQPDNGNPNSAHNTQVYQVTRSGHEHCDVTEGILLDITPLVVDGRKLVTLYDKDLTEGVNLLIVVSDLWGSQCVRLKVTTKTDNCGENADCSGKGVCYSNPAMEDYECQCCSGFAGPHCEEIDACTPSPCTNNGICVDLSQGHEGNSYQCLCPYGYSGKNCQYETDPCNPTECLNGGSCVGNSTHFRCDCTPGFTGPVCQHSLNECESSPCVHGICVDQEDGFRCFCQPGFAGELCNFEYNECESNPCQNSGECIDHIGSYECRCTKGYTGKRCQIKVDFCANKPCPDGQKCIDHGNEFSCQCPGGLNGLNCNQMPRAQCNVNPCTHGGTCWTSGESFYCACRPGYTGTMCEDEFVVETVVSSSEFIVDDTSARNLNDKAFGSSVVLKSPIELHNAYFAAGVLAAAIFIVAIVVTICHCKVNQTYRKFSTRTTTFFPILGFGRRPKMQNKLNKHWLSGKSVANAGGGGGGSCPNGSGNPLRSSSSSASLTRGHLAATNGNQYTTTGGAALHERPFQRHLAMNLENDMYYTVDFSENSQHSPLIQ